MKPAAAHILIVDDDQVNLTLVNKLLQQAGYTTCCAYDGIEGLQLFEKFAPHLVLTDILMPRLGGYDLVQRLRQHPGSAHVQIIMMSTLTDPDDQHRAGAAGADAFLQKPIQQTELLDCVELLLARAPVVR